VKKLLAFLTFLGLCASLSVGSVGCKGKKDDKKKEAPAPEAPSIELKAGSVDLKPGEKKETKITAKGTNVTSDIELKFTKPDAKHKIKVTIDDKVKPGEQAKVEVEAEKDAKEGKVDIEVTGTAKGAGDKTADAKTTLTVTIEKLPETVKDKITITATDVDLKPGEKGKAKVTATRQGKGAEGDITVKVEGVKQEAKLTINDGKDIVIPKGKNEVEFPETAAEAAPEETVTATLRAGTGEDINAEAKMKITVKKK